MEWIRRWAYELRWSPDYRGSPVRSREVAGLAELRAVIAWARSNPHVIGYSYRQVDHLIGERAESCRRGHPLLVYPAAWRRSLWLTCAGCPGHHLAVCQCGDRVIEPAPGPDCGPPAAGADRR